MKPRLIAGMALLALGIGTQAPAAADWNAGGGEAWQTMLDAAREEGAVVVAGPPHLGQPFASAFERDTGIRMDYIAGGFRDLRVRFNRELEAGQPTIDVHFSGSSALLHMKDGLLVPVGDKLVLPGVTNPANWLDGDLGWIDNEGRYLIQPNEYVSGRVFVNTDEIDPASVTSWQDLLAPEFKGKIASHDPTFPGAGQAVATNLLDVFGEQFVRDFYEGQEVPYSREGRQLVEWLVRGTYPVIVGPIAFEIERFRDAGVENIGILELSDAPGYIVGGSAVPAVPKGSPNPNAAMVFLNWYLSQNGQQVYADVMQVPSRRLDVNNDNSPFYVVATEGVAYQNQYEEDYFFQKRSALRRAVTDLLKK